MLEKSQVHLYTDVFYEHQGGINYKRINETHCSSALDGIYTFIIFFNELIKSEFGNMEFFKNYFLNQQLKLI